MIKKVAATLAAACLLAASLAAQDKKEKPWTEWSKKDAEKVLNDSPWGQTQAITDTSQMFFAPTAPPAATGASARGVSSDANSAASGATNQATNVKYHIRFFSARPVRQALARMLMLNNTQLNPSMAERLKNFAELQTNDSIIIAVTYESNDARFGNVAMQAFNSAITATLKNNTYLERNDGTRVYIDEYVPPGKDGFGARFIFPRKVGETPFITSDTSEVRFASVLDKIELNMRYKVAKMSYNGALEY